MKSVIIGLVLALGVVGCAEDAEAGDSNIYIAGGAGVTNYNFDGSSDDSNGTNYFGLVGYDFGNNLAIEGEYAYVDTADIASNAEVNETSYYQINGVGRLPIDNKDKVNLLAKIGFGYADTKLKIDNSSNPDDTTWYPVFGLGAEWMVTDSVGVMGLVDYKIYDFSTGGNDFSVDPVTYRAGLVYKF